MVLFPLKWVWIPYLLHMFLILSPRPCEYYMTMYPLVYLSLVVPLPSGSLLLLSLLYPLCPLWLFPSLLFSWLLLLNLHSLLSNPHLGYLHLARASLRCCISWLRSFGLLQTVLALWVRVLMTLNLYAWWWWLSHWRYWSVCVSFLYTVRCRVLSAWGFTMVSRNGIAPSCWLFSTVNLMAGSTLLICSRKFCLYPSCWMTKLSSTYLSQSLGVVVAVLRAVLSKYSM